MPRGGNTDALQSSELSGHEQIEDFGDSDGENFTALTDRSLPPHLKEISSLASWTVSTSKPGNGVAALRHPSPSQFWQSDGPQPHTLNVHFFKFVAISYMRIYIDFEQDESYTPIKLEFLAGTGHHDLQKVCEMEPKNPKGWIDVDLSNAGGPSATNEMELQAIDEAEEEVWAAQQHSPELLQDEEAMFKARKASVKWHSIGTGPTLRCFLVQLRILENHQNGKDTHLRGLQIFARDELYTFSRKRTASRGLRSSMSHSTSLTTGSGDGRDVFGESLGTQGAGWMSGGWDEIPPSASSTQTPLAAQGGPRLGTVTFERSPPAEESHVRVEDNHIIPPEATAAARTGTRKAGRERARKEPDWMGEIERGIGNSDLR